CVQFCSLANVQQKLSATMISIKRKKCNSGVIPSAEMSVKMAISLASPLPICYIPRPSKYRTRTEFY
ncbi:MAG: hypothetical protein PHI31_18595, partial [Desulfuromonadaceae bacterium]|nr:hypothetical protein [Desulfuromonadaceae bacterium]